MKTCSKCGLNKALTEFQKGRPDCRLCLKAYKAEHYQANKSEINKKNREWYETNKPRVSTYNRERYLATREAWIARSKKYREENPDRYRNNFLRKNYGITLDAYDKMLAEQNGACAICKGPPTGRGKKLGIYYVDHDHVTGKVRGLLCSHCNSMLGYAKDECAILTAAQGYLLKHQMEVK